MYPINYRQKECFDRFKKAIIGITAWLAVTIMFSYAVWVVIDHIAGE